MRFTRRNGNGNGTHPAAYGGEPELAILESTRPAPAEKVAMPATGLLQKPELIDAKVRLHRKLIDELNLSLIDKISPTELREQVYDVISDYVLSERLPLNALELDAFVNEVMDELTGLGPIEPFLKDPTVSDILINTHEHVYVERFGQLESVPVRFKDEAHVLRIANKIVSAVGRRVDESQPMVDARLIDGSRVNVAIRPVAVDGPLVSIRKFVRHAYDMESLIAIGTLAPAMALILSEAVRARLSIVISGGTGSGKTTFLNALSRSISHKERLITIEDAAELQLQQPHVGRLETRPPNIEGDGEIRQRELVKNALRMRPDRIIVGEVRGEEAFDMLQAMSTGHEGSMTTIHSNTPRDAVVRLEQMIGMAGFRMSESTIRSHIASAIKIIVQLQRFPDGKRRVTSISEITGMEGQVVQMQELYAFVVTGPTRDGAVTGEYRATGLRPSFLNALLVNGAEIPDAAFHPGVRL
jgi:pilus assembly protein CpaF